ncbi:unnamed protein product, partial [marine sediment metagenome]
PLTTISAKLQKIELAEAQNSLLLMSTFRAPVGKRY